MKNTVPLLLFCLLQLIKLSGQTVSLSPHATGFNWLAGVEQAPGDPRLYAFTKDGYIKIVNTDGSVLSTPFLDINSQVNNLWSNEQGLVGLAFHPDYQDNGFFYVFYNQVGTGICTISRFMRSATNPDQADPTSEGILLMYEHPLPNHVGGCMKFGPDGYLYIGTGDGGGAGDPEGSGQNLLSFKGKILRIDVGNQGGMYTVPPDNPFVGVANTAPEIWAFGLRNPWRFNFDRWTGDLWIGDVGQDQREEVNFQSSNSTGGTNYGWSCKEGMLDYNSNQCFAGSNYTYPLFEYNHDGQECSITGGVVYRGTKYADLFGRYLFTDFCSGKIWGLLNDGIPTVGQLGNFNDNDFTALEEDEAGDLYAVGYFSNTIYKVQSSNCSPVAWLVAAPEIVLPLGGSVQLNAYGSGMNYQWLLNGQPIPNANENFLVATTGGTYTVMVTNPENGCSNTSNPVAVLQSVPIQVFPTVSDITCFGDDDGWIELEVSGGTGNYSFSWSNGASTANISGLEAGIYGVTISDGIDTITIQILVSGPGGPLGIDFLVTPEQDSAFVEVFTNGGTPPYQYLWSTGGTDTVISAAANIAYSLTVTDDNGCTITDQVTYVFLATGETSILQKFNIFPNPAKDELAVSVQLGQAAQTNVQLRDGLGSVVQTLLPMGYLSAGETKFKAATAALPPGVYFVVVNVDGKIAAKKLLKL